MKIIRNKERRNNAETAYGKTADKYQRCETRRRKFNIAAASAKRQQSIDAVYWIWVVIS